METLSPEPRLWLLLDHFAAIEDDRPAWRVPGGPGAVLGLLYGLGRPVLAGSTGAGGHRRVRRRGSAERTFRGYV
jgi:hypothetical protein